jgi:hypothetical protein
MTFADDPLATTPQRPLWLVTLADLALLLVGFLLLVQATADKPALARALREGFDGPADAPVAVAGTLATFAPGSAALSDTATLVAFAREALADDRVQLSVTGSATDAEGVLLAADRARAVAGALVAAGMPGDRLVLLTARGNPRATLTVSFSRTRP